MDTARPTLAEARRRLRAALGDDGAGLHPHGPAWRRDLLGASRRLLGSARPGDRALGARGLALLAELAALYGAPSAARALLREGRRALRAPPRARDGRTRAGSAGAANAADVDAGAALRAVARALRDHPRTGHPADERLARDAAAEALRYGGAARSGAALRRRARVLGAAGDVEGALAAWTKLARSRAHVDLEPADWFYLPEALFDDARFWRVLARILPRLRDRAVFVHASGVRDAVAPPGSRPRGATLLATRRAVVRAHLARTRARAGARGAPAAQST
jgi:hypothetical protein